MNEHLRNNNTGVFQFSGRRLVVSMLRDFDGLDNSQ